MFFLEILDDSELFVASPVAAPASKGRKKVAAPKAATPIAPTVAAAPTTPKAVTPKAATRVLAAAAAVVVEEAPAAKGGKRGGFKGKAATKAAAPTTPQAAAPTSAERSHRTPTPSAKVLAALADAVVVSPAVVAVRKHVSAP